MRPAVEARPKLLTVRIGRETFGLPIGRVQTTFRIEAVTPIPLGPPAVLGLVNLRGAVIPALSLRRRLMMPDEASALGQLAVGIDAGPEAFALVVDDVGDVIAVDVATLQPLPPHVNGARASLMLAFYHLPTGILPVLDVSALMAFGGRDAAPAGRPAGGGAPSQPRFFADPISNGATS